MIYRSHSSSSAWFSRYLLQAMGLGVAAVSLGSGACGGRVIVDGISGAGGAGGANTTSSDDFTSTGYTSTTGATTTSTATGPNGFTCNEPVLADLLLYACMETPQGEGCPAKESSLVFDDLAKQLNNPTCDGVEVRSIACGPDPNGLGCCYVAAAAELLCGGRPFIVNGAARTAEIAARSDWRSPLSPDLSGLDDADRAALAFAWARDALDEHASVASFARFAIELLAVGAPAELVLAAQQAMGEEIRHAELCFGLASAYAGADLGPTTLPAPGALGDRTSLSEVAAAVVREGCVGETLAAFGALAARDVAVDPAVRASLEEISRDEIAHAGLAWRFVAWALAEGDAAVTQAVESAFAAALATPIEIRDDGRGSPQGSRAEAHGRLSVDGRRAALAEAMRDVVRPCARTLLGAYRRTDPQRAEA
jgi:hypothetical protein